MLTEDASENDVFALTSGIFLKLNHFACTSKLNSMHVKSVCNAASLNQHFFLSELLSGLGNIVEIKCKSIYRQSTATLASTAKEKGNFNANFVL